MNRKIIVPDQYNSDWPNFKRLMEKCCADRRFLKDFLDNPEEKLQYEANSLSAASASQAVAALLGQARTDSGGDNVYRQMFREIITDIQHDADERYNQAEIANEQFRKWFIRQQKRVLFECSVNRRKTRYRSIPINFELSEGCSGGCSFCCLQPDRLSDCFRYDETNRLLWHDILNRTKSVLGNFAGQGTCYFATEPLDNPDYEQFIEDFYNCFGNYPQTTTVKAADQPDRIRKLMKKLGQEHLRQAALRFSVTSAGQLTKIHEAFSAEELKHVELLLNNRESMNRYSLAGRAVKLAKELEPEKFAAAATSICTAGFVVNLVKRTVTLMAPRRADIDHPLGLKEYQTRTFENGKSYQDVLTAMIREWMPEDMPPDRRLDMGSYITFERSGSQLKIQGDKIHRSLTVSDACYQCLALVVGKGHTLEQAFAISKVSNEEKNKITEKLQVLFDAGYLMI